MFSYSNLVFIPCSHPCSNFDPHATYIHSFNMFVTLCMIYIVGSHVGSCNEWRFVERRGAKWKIVRFCRIFEGGF